MSARDTLNELLNGAKALSEMDATFMADFWKLDEDAGRLGLDEKTKELIFVALSVDKRCKYCICRHVYNAYKAGASKVEIMSAGQVAIAMGAGPNVAYNATAFLEALNEFEHDFDADK